MSAVPFGGEGNIASCPVVDVDMSTSVQPQYSRGQAGTSSPVTTIAILGAGRVGTTLARVLANAGFDVRVAGPAGPEGIRLIVEVVAPGARALDASDAIDGADVVILAIPLHRLHTIDPALLDGRVVVDVMNYWPPIDGNLPEFDDAVSGTSTVVAQRLQGARIVKAFNHIGYHDIETDARPPGANDRRAIAVASDDRLASDMVMSMIDATGFDPVDAGPLERGRLLEAGGDVFGVRMGAEQLRSVLGV